MDTKIIKLNRILKQIDVVDQFVQKRLLSWEKVNRNTTYDQLFYTMNKKGQNYYKKINAKSLINFNLKHSKVGYTPRLIQVHEHIEKLKPMLDGFLWPLINIGFSFTNNNKHYSGLYYGGWRRQIVIQMYGKYEEKDECVLTTVNHEIGHAWASQLCFLAQLNYEKTKEILIKTIMQFFIGLGIILPNNKIMSFKELKPLLQEYISEYSGKNIDEAFAEIFSYAFPPIKAHYNSPEKQIYCHNAIKYFNSHIRIFIIKEFDNKSV